MEQGILAGEQGTPPSLWEDGVNQGALCSCLFPPRGRSARLM
jgi:hypothetical protein